MNLDDLKNLQNLDPQNPGSWPVFVKVGACVVLFSAALGMMFMGGVPVSRFFSWMLVAVSAFTPLSSIKL